MPQREWTPDELAAMAAITAAHDEAVRQHEPTYLDPLTGYAVFTREYHLQRGACCDSACRHCPY